MDISQESLNLEQFFDQLTLCSSEDTAIQSEAHCKMDVLSRDIQALFMQGRNIKVKTHADMIEVEWSKKEFFELLRKLADSNLRYSFGIKKYFPFAFKQMENLSI